jgi:hypothetical protein
MKRQKHSLSHYILNNGYAGYLQPIGCVEVLPGDTMQHATSMLIRANPMSTPPMHPVQVKVHHFYVPTRILWDGFTDFITGGDTGNDSQIPPRTPVSEALGFGTIPECLGVPIVDGLEISLLPIRAYNKVFNEYYRDQDLVPEVDEDSMLIQRAAWEKDRFSSARPWTQKGDEIALPITGEMEIARDGPFIFESADGLNTDGVAIDGSNSYQAQNGNMPNEQSLAYSSGLRGDLTTATMVNVNDFRRGFALQRYAEARARYGSRFTEYLRYLGVKSSDARLQRPEFIGGGKANIAFSEVLQTATDDIGQEQTPVGTMRGHGISGLKTRRYRRFFEEHGFVISVMTIRPKAIYTNGLPKMWSRMTREDYYQKELQHIGQEPVLNKEVYADGTAEDEETFGYNDRYRDYMEQPSVVAGKFRTSEEIGWTFARNFETRPALNQTFIECEAPTHPFAVPDSNGSDYKIMVNHSIQARRIVKRSSVGRII